MGLRFQKSFNLGAGFKINLSKSGIGYSWGIPGFRKTKLCNGRKRTTFNIPGTGISYIKEKENTRMNMQSQNKLTATKVAEFSSISVENTNDDAIIKLEQANKKYLTIWRLILNFMILSLVFIFSIALSSFMPMALAIAIGFVVSFILLAKNNNRYKSNLDYTLDEESQNFYNDAIYALKILNSCDKVWYKRWYGDIEIVLKKKVPYFIKKSNTDLYYLDLGGIKFYFLPDRIIRLSGNKFSYFGYNSFECSVIYKDTYERKAKDICIIHQKWKYANKDGSCDHRYHNNRCLNTYRYAEITVKDNINKPIVLICSNINKVQNFISRLEYIKSKYKISSIQQRIKPMIYSDNIKEIIRKNNSNVAIETKNNIQSEHLSKQQESKQKISELKNEIDFRLFYDGTVKCMKIKQYSDFKAELYELDKNGNFIEIKNKTMPILNGFMNKYVTKKAANTRHAVDLFIKFIKTTEGKSALEEWNRMQQ